MRGTFSDMARRGSTSSSTPPAVVSQPESEATETKKSKPAKSFLKDFVDTKGHNLPSGDMSCTASKFRQLIKCEL